MKNLTSLLSIIFILLNTSTVTEVYAWGKTWLGRELENRVNEARWEIGPLRIRPIFSLRNAGYDSNIYRRALNPVEDFTFTLGPGLYFYLPIKKKILLSVYESPQYVYFKETTQERSWNNFFTGHFHMIFNRLLLTVGKTASVSREIWNTEIDIRPQRKEDGLQSSAFFQMSKKTAVLLKYSRTKYDYEDLSFEKINIKDELNRIENYVNFITYYKISYRTTLFIETEYGSFDFEDPANIRDTKSYAVYGGFEFSPSAPIRGKINIGYKLFEPLASGQIDYKGVVGNSNIEVRLSRFLNLKGMYKRDVEFSVWYGNPYFLETRYGFGLSVYPVTIIRLDYNFQKGKNIYPERSYSAEDRQYDREDDHRIHSAGIFFRLKKNFGIGISSLWWQRDSSLDWWDGTRNLIGLNLTYDF